MAVIEGVLWHIDAVKRNTMFYDGDSLIRGIGDPTYEQFLDEMRRRMRAAYPALALAAVILVNLLFLARRHSVWLVVVQSVLVVYVLGLALYWNPSWGDSHDTSLTPPVIEAVLLTTPAQPVGAGRRRRARDPTRSTACSARSSPTCRGRPPPDVHQPGGDQDDRHQGGGNHGERRGTRWPALNQTQRGYTSPPPADQAMGEDRSADRRDGAAQPDLQHAGGLPHHQREVLGDAERDAEIPRDAGDLVRKRRGARHVDRPPPPPQQVLRCRPTPTPGWYAAW